MPKSYAIINSSVCKLCQLCVITQAPSEQIEALSKNVQKCTAMDQRAFQFDTRGQCIKGKHFH